MRNRCFYLRYGKRTFDAITAGLLLLLLSPLLLLLGLLVRARLGSPVLFRQLRPGLNGRPFLMYKFRTMTDARDSNGTLLSDAERLTSFGRWMRSTSLDELPQLWNVLRGEMSLVGPRPLVMDYLERYSPDQARRHEVKPGITGWAQVNGRNNLEWEEKFRFDVWYVDHVNWRLDLRILWRTIGVVLRREGISYGNEATVIEFQGMPRRELLEPAVAYDVSTADTFDDVPATIPFVPSARQMRRSKSSRAAA